jgi:riboflavin biosynthesis pyrimidine reductase
MMTPGTELEPLDRLYEDESIPQVALPDELAHLHDGDLGFPAQCLYANFVTTLDGVVAIPAMPRSNDFVAGDSDADRFLMGLLRAFADVVLIGSGVLRASPTGTWQPERIFARAAPAYAELRELLGASRAPEVAVLTGSGAIDPRHPLFEWGAVVLTSTAGAESIGTSLPAASTVVALGASTWIEPRLVVDALRERGHRRILSEAGPHTFGELLEAELVDELFLTASPLMVGAGEPGSRLRLVEGADLTPEGTRLRLVSLRRHGSHLFHRYAIDRAARG